MKSFRLESGKEEGERNMKIYEKILIAIDIVLTLFYSMIILSSYKNISDGLGVLIGALIPVYLVSYLIAHIVAKLSKSSDKQLTAKKLLTKTYLILILLVIIGSLK